MTILAVLEAGLFALGQVLRLPIIAALWICVGFTVFFAGQILAAFLRRRTAAQFELGAWLAAGSVLNTSADRQRALPAHLRTFLSGAKQLHEGTGFTAGSLEKLVLDEDAQLRRPLERLQALVKIGPSLGLIGTLIPMGSSLAAMASGDLQGMAGQMVVAFTTTIIGLAVGTVCYCLAFVYQRWTGEAVRNMRYLAEALASEDEEHAQ
ncbi:MAG: MotA/TolQ/ExbB proton channel family protein [Pseudomonadota bacterium]